MYSWSMQRSKHPDEAITFLKWLTSDEVQAKMVYELGFLPCTNVQLDADKCMSETLEIINKNMDAPGISEWLDCALNQTVADTYLIGRQTIFEDENGESIMKEVSETAKEVLCRSVTRMAIRYSTAAGYRIFAGKV